MIRHERIRALLDEIKYERSGFERFQVQTISIYGTPDETSICPIFRRVCAVSGVEALSDVPARLIPSGWDDGQIVRAAFAMILSYEEHETREGFLWRGRAVFGPHQSVESLWAISGERKSSNG